MTLNFRVPPGMDAERARQAVASHLPAVAPWRAHIHAKLLLEAA